MPETCHSTSRLGVLEASGGKAGGAAVSEVSLSLQAGPSAETVQLAEQALTSATPLK